MIFKDFIFSFFQSLKLDIKKKEYIKFFKRIFFYPYKFLLDKIREFFLIKKINLDKHPKIKSFKDMTLGNLFYEFNADKGLKFKINNNEIDGHNYTPFYEKYISKYKNKKDLNILEIGSLRGGGTASFFYYFENPKIFCADINPFQIQVFSNRIRKFFLNTQSKESISNLNSYINEEFDLIIDDGSHNIRDQIITFCGFFQNLKKNGIYIIEDSSQYKASKNLNVDNLGYGAKEILLSLKLEDNLKVDYLSQDEAKKMKNKIKNLFIEQGNFIQNDINISEILFIEKN